MQEHFEDAILTASVDGDDVVIDVTLKEPINLPWGPQLRGYSLVLGRRGFLMACTRLSEPDALLSVSPESLVQPS